jgi:hypothetical protein
MLQQQGAAEIIRLCVREDSRHAASALAGRLRRVGQALGFERIATYTLPEEGGASLRAAGWQQDMELAGGGEWSRPSRGREVATHPTARKARWWAALKKQAEIEL